METGGDKLEAPAPESARQTPQPATTQPPTSETPTDEDLSGNFLRKYIMGDMQAVNDWFANKPVVLQFPNWLLRAAGAPIFLNNPVSGLLIIVAMFVSNAWIAVNALLGLIIAIMTAMALKLDRNDIASGGATFHGMLVGIVLASSIQTPDWYPWVLFPVLVMAAISVFLAAGLGTLFGKVGLPAFNLPFIVAAFVFLAAARYTITNPHFPLAPAAPAPEASRLDRDTIDWAKLFYPMLLGGAQIYGSKNLVAGGLILVAQFICSPIIAIHAVLSAVLSVLTALAMAAPLSEIYDGLWSYNAMLTCTALGGVFYVISVPAHIIALCSAIFATLVYGALGAMLRPTGLPVIAFPFVISASIFLSVTSGSSSLKRVPIDAVSFPENNRKMFKRNNVADIPV